MSASAIIIQASEANQIHQVVNVLKMIKAKYLNIFSSLLITLFSFNVVLLKAQTSTSFTSIPAAVNGTINLCLGNSITYTNTSTGTDNNTNYNCIFQCGTPNNSNQIGPHTEHIAMPVIIQQH